MMQPRISLNLEFSASIARFPSTTLGMQDQFGLQESLNLDDREVAQKAKDLAAEPNKLGLILGPHGERRELASSTCLLTPTD